MCLRTSQSFSQAFRIILIIFIAITNWSVLQTAATDFGNNIETINQQLCKKLCQCTVEAVDCNRQDNLKFLPTVVSEHDYKKLHISHASFHNRGLTRKNFSTISHLTSLRIVYSKLEYIEDRAFSFMDRLLDLDLSNNNFNTIAPKAFFGLNLATLYLEGNLPGLKIDKNSFDGLKVKKLYLVRNKIKELPYEPFVGMEIKMLHLFNNSIETLDRNFEKIFKNPDCLIDLTMNPLNCPCGFDWFSRLIKSWDNVNSYIKMKCARPLYLKDKLIKYIEQQEFPCEVPQINKISIDVSQKFIKLICYAKGSNRPKLTWKQINLKTGIEISHVEDLRKFEHHSFVSLNVTDVQRDNTFVCSASNEVDMSSQVTVKLKLVDDFLKEISNSKRNKNENVEKQNNNNNKNNNNNNNNKDENIISKNPNLTSETHFLFRKQFSILQMIGAVVGTFTSVVILILIIYCTQEHIMKKHASSTNPYWTIVPTDPKYHQQQQQQRMYQTTLPVTLSHNNNNNFLLSSSANHNPIGLTTSPMLTMTGSTHSQDYDIPQYDGNNFLPNARINMDAPNSNNNSGIKPINSYFNNVT